MDALRLRLMKLLPVSRIFILSVTIAAVTIEEGPFSDALSVMMDEDSKQQQLSNMYMPSKGRVLGLFSCQLCKCSQLCS